MTDGFMEPHPLWEYPSYPMSSVHEIFSIDFVKGIEEDVYEKSIKMRLENEGLLNGVAIWSTLEFDAEDETLKIDSGLIEKPVKNKHLKWNRGYKQAVHILEKKHRIAEADLSNTSLNCMLTFNVKQGAFNVDFKVDKNDHFEIKN